MADLARDFLQDATGDLAAVAGDFATVAGQAAVLQGIRVRVQTFLGEIFLNQDLGVDWLNQILVKNPDAIVVRELLREAIADTPDVTDVIGAQLRKVVDRSYVINFKVLTVFSSTPLEGSVEVLA